MQSLKKLLMKTLKTSSKHLEKEQRMLKKLVSMVSSSMEHMVISLILSLEILPIEEQTSGVALSKTDAD